MSGMLTILKAIILVPIAIVALAFAVANRQAVTVSFDPFSPDTPAFAMVAPLFLMIFLLLMVGVLIGGVAAWLGQGRYRRATRRAEVESDELRAENQRLKTELAIQARQASEARQVSVPALMPAYDV